jgi:16S rRNA (guanine966-N2)-methyltransferase
VAFPAVEGLRPTPDRVRETVFNWISPRIAGARVLDLFAGSGILGLEALSRGAASVVAVERHRLVAERLRDAARELDAGDFEVVATDVMSFLATARKAPFDIVFVDPPHGSADYVALCEALESSGLVAPDALIYLEFPKSRVSGFHPPAGWTRRRSSRAGHVIYQLWQRVAAPD